MGRVLITNRESTAAVNYRKTRDTGDRRNTATSKHRKTPTVSYSTNTLRCCLNLHQGLIEDWNTEGETKQWSTLHSKDALRTGEQNEPRNPTTTEWEEADCML